VRDQVVSPFPTAASRTSAITAPVTGMLTHRADLPGLEGYDGAGWTIAGLYQVLARKTADESLSSSTTLQDDDALAWTVRASGIYRLDLWLLYISGTTPDLKIGWSYPAGCTMKWGWLGNDTSLSVINAAGYDQTSTPALGGSSLDLWARIHAVVTVSATAGTLTLKWAQNTSDGGTTTVRAGSHGLMTRLA
jgi:hypothetical protein